MNNKRAGYFYIGLGCVSLVGGVACLAWADSLGGYKFLGATAAIFLAMLSFTQFNELRRAKPAARVARVNVPSRAPDDNTGLAPLAAGPRAREDAELAARLAALRAARQQSAVAPLASAAAEPEPEFEPDEPAPTPWVEPDTAVVVIEGPPPDSMPAELADAGPAPSREAMGMRQMDELRAEIARLRDGSRKRQTGGAPPAGASQSPFPTPDPAFERTQIQRRDSRDPRNARDAFERTEFTGLQDAPAPTPDAFPRTEFSDLASPAPDAPAPFTKTEFLGPI